jgi:ubiquitin-conjugating enzyme E2 O
VGQYDSENNFWSNADSDNESWVTEDETSEPGGNLPEKEVSKPRIVSNLERARVAMSRLEEMFMINPSLQNQEVIESMLNVKIKVINFLLLGHEKIAYGV